MTCTACGGRGHVPLAFEMQATLLLLRERRFLSATDLAKMLPGLKQTAANNRLEHLRRVGLADRKSTTGRRWVYFPVSRKVKP